MDFEAVPPDMATSLRGGSSWDIFATGEVDLNALERLLADKQFPDGSELHIHSGGGSICGQGRRSVKCTVTVILIRTKSGSDAMLTGCTSAGSSENAGFCCRGGGNRGKNNLRFLASSTAIGCRFTRN